ncbi:MAG: hypothetical protein KKG47_12380 [Proteobacteria bacterium]|nr:hypothetical protein [Pseudomonadota bacterium]MBU1737739.1 hypothetical protein [Pseudomonadota bacterium]
MKEIATVLLLILLLSGCSAAMGRVSRDSGRQAPVVYVHPLQNVYGRASLAVLPFQVPEGREGAFSDQVAALFRDVLLGKRSFPLVKLVDQEYGDPVEAAAIGRKAGVDLVLAGRVNYVVSGTELGGAGVDVSIRLINTSTGNTVWYIRQSCKYPWEYPDNNFMKRVLAAMVMENPREPLPGQAVPELLARVAVDMADVVAGYAYLN